VLGGVEISLAVEYMTSGAGQAQMLSIIIYRYGKIRHGIKNHANLILMVKYTCRHRPMDIVNTTLHIVYICRVEVSLG